MDDKTIFIFDAEAGNKLSRDVVMPDGSILVPKNTVLDMELISKISSYHILEISIYDDAKEESSYEDEDSSNSVEVEYDTDVSVPIVETYYDKLRQSPEFQDFSESYSENVNNLANKLNDVVTNNVPISTNEIIGDTMKIIGNSRNNLQLFDMLHSMRQFDDSTYVHSVNVALINSIIGDWAGLNKESIKQLVLAGLLHDIGKLLIPEEILNKPGKLSASEYEIMKNHVFLGYDKLKEQNIDQRIKEACLFHHEKMDGSGYPFALSGDKVPMFARITAISDVYDAMTANRVYRGSICPFEVVDMMQKDAFSKFDPAYAIPFLKKVVSAYVRNDVMLSDGQVGTVIMINDSLLSKPIVQCGDKFIDLSKQSKLSITAIL